MSKGLMLESKALRRYDPTHICGDDQVLPVKFTFCLLDYGTSTVMRFIGTSLTFQVALSGAG